MNPWYIIDSSGYWWNLGRKRLQVVDERLRSQPCSVSLYSKVGQVFLSSIALACDNQTGVHRVEVDVLWSCLSSAIALRYDRN